MTTTTKKGLYHSELAKRGEAEIKILSEVKQSKYEGKPPYVFIELDGAERTYSIENARIEGKLILRSKGEVLRIKATGSRDEADIEILNGERGDDSGEPGTRPVAGSIPAAPTVRSTSSNDSNSLDALGVSSYAALGKADEVITQFFSEEQRSGWSAYEAADLVLRLAIHWGISLEKR